MRRRNSDCFQLSSGPIHRTSSDERKYEVLCHYLYHLHYLDDPTSCFLLLPQTKSSSLVKAVILFGESTDSIMLLVSTEIIFQLIASHFNFTFLLPSSVFSFLPFLQKRFCKLKIFYFYLFITFFNFYHLLINFLIYINLQLRKF